jgi:hypothetical protein
MALCGIRALDSSIGFVDIKVSIVTGAIKPRACWQAVSWPVSSVDFRDTNRSKLAVSVARKDLLAGMAPSRTAWNGADLIGFSVLLARQYVLHTVTAPEFALSKYERSFWSLALGTAAGQSMT